MTNFLTPWFTHAQPDKSYLLRAPGVQVIPGFEEICLLSLGPFFKELNIHKQWGQPTPGTGLYSFTKNVERKLADKIEDFHWMYLMCTICKTIKSISSR